MSPHTVSRDPVRGMTRLADLPLLKVAGRAEWRAWLEHNYSTSPGVWLAVGKKGNPRTTLTYEEAVEEALCFGWIDSLMNRLDAHHFKQLFTPRSRGSGWARTNKCRVERLVAQGLMTDAGSPPSRPPKPTDPGRRSTTWRTWWCPANRVEVPQ